MLNKTLFKNLKNKKYSFYLNKGSLKFFDLHEYQSKHLLKKYGLKVQKGDLAQSPEEAKKIGSNLEGELIIKAQVHAGGRGKGKLSSGLQGGVKLCKNVDELTSYAKQMIGYDLVTNQTTKNGLPVKSVLVLEAVDIQEQYYLAFILERTYQSPVLIISKEGGVEIEEVAKKNPDAIKKFPIDVQKGLTQETIDQAVETLELNTQKQQEQAKDQLQKMYKLFISSDSTQIEINPWALDKNGELYFVDAKINIDDSATFRQKEIMDMRKNSKGSEDTDPSEEKANEYGLNYIGLDGNIGCMVNGAGLAMATMDIIKLKNGEPANFLDVGGSATKDQVKQAFSILKNHENVKTILVNIFGGIMRCDTIANGIIEAVQEVGVEVPVVIRLTGTNSEQGRELLEQFAAKNKGKVNFMTAKDLDEAAKISVKTVSQLVNKKI